MAALVLLACKGTIAHWGTVCQQWQRLANRVLPTCNGITWTVGYLDAIA